MRDNSTGRFRAARKGPKVMAAEKNKPYVVKEGFNLGQGKDFVVGDLVFVGNEGAPAELGIKVLTPDEFRQVPAGHLEPAVDSQVQTKARDKALAEVQVYRRNANEAENGLKAAQHRQTTETERLETEVREAKYRNDVAQAELKKGEERFAAKLAIFGLPAEDAPTPSTPAPDSAEDKNKPEIRGSQARAGKR